MAENTALQEALDLAQYVKEREAAGIFVTSDDKAIVTLAAEVQRLQGLELDARRYQWLRSQARTEDRDGGWSGFWRFPFLDAWNDSPNKEYSLPRRSVDAALDAALSAQGAAS